MPVLIAVDVSLSMHPYLNAKNDADTPNAVSFIKSLIARFESYLYREYIALAYLGEEMSVIVDFTKEYQPLVKTVEKNLSSTTATVNFLDCCTQAIQLCHGCYSSLDLIQILIITHSKVNMNSINSHLDDENSTLSRILRANNVSISFILFDNPKHFNLDKQSEMIERFININMAGGKLYQIEVINLLTWNRNVTHTAYRSSNWKRTVDKLFDENFRPFHATLALGSMKSDVHVTPRILNLDIRSDPDTLDEPAKVSLEIFGFVKLSDLSNPVIASRHLITARASEKKLGKIITPDPWKAGARSTTGGGGRQLGENKALTANKNRFNPYQASTTFKKCRICRSVVHQAGSHYCQGCAYKKGICAMCGKKMLDTKNYKQSAV